MTAGKKPKKEAPQIDTYEASSTVIGMAFAMPEGAGLVAMAEGPPIDFQAKQDSIALTRRDPGPKLAPKLKRTTADPAKAKETKITL